MIENTTQRDPALHLLGAMSEGTDGYILGMEAAGQAQVVNSDVLPADAPWDEFTALGIVKGEPVEGDELFVHCTLPEGWKKAPTDHSMWSQVRDERGIERVAVFYKAAFYDRKAHAQIADPGSSLANEVFYGDAAAALPPQWDVLTDEERSSFWKALDSMADAIERHPDIYGEHAPKVTALQALRPADA